MILLYCYNLTHRWRHTSIRTPSMKFWFQLAHFRPTKITNWQPNNYPQTLLQQTLKKRGKWFRSSSAKSKKFRSTMKKLQWTSNFRQKRSFFGKVWKVCMIIGVCPLFQLTVKADMRMTAREDCMRYTAVSIWYSKCPCSSGFTMMKASLKWFCQ